MGMESHGERTPGRFIQPPPLAGAEFTVADYVFIAAVLAKKQPRELPNPESIKALYDLGIEAGQHATESRKRLEEAGHTGLREWQVTSDVSAIRAIARHVIHELQQLNPDF